ncbi:MAG TPA: hypothetical protein VIZ70_07450 [Propionibacteriaceae bacterium]
MADTDQVSVAARSLAAQRWGASKPIRLAQELAGRVSELPEPERARLLAALTRRAVDGQS